MNLLDLQRFHTERREKAITVFVEKSTTRMLWLDTSVLLNFAKLDKNQNIEAVLRRRLTRLRSVVRNAVREERLICPEWDQSVEFESLKIEEETRVAVTDLSCGARCIPYAGIKDLQGSLGLKAYLELADTIRIPSNIHFYDDPLELVKQAKIEGFVVESGLRKPKDWIDKAKRDKHQTHTAMEELRKGYSSAAQTFDNQLALERVGESDAMIHMVDKFIKARMSGHADFWGYMGVEGFLKTMNEWRQMGGPDQGYCSDLAALYSFMRSPYYWELPIVDISCRLSADLLVKHFVVKSGDSQDIHHLSTAIPIAHYVVADKAMVDRCERLGIDKKWNTKLFATKTLNDLSDEISAI